MRSGQAARRKALAHVTFGNHEDDIDTEALRARVAEFVESGGVWLATNVTGFTPALPAHHIVEVSAPGGRSVRVGLIGSQFISSIHAESLKQVSRCKFDLV